MHAFSPKYYCKYFQDLLIGFLINIASKLGVDAKMLKSSWETNLKVRPEKDWENLKGRSVVE